MSTPVHSYLRTHRRRWALTQRELAFLVGRNSSTHVSRLEHDKRMPRTDIMLACAVLFGVTPADMFPKIHADVEEEVLARAAKLYEVLEKKTSKDAMRKKELLNILLERAITRLITTEGE